MHVVRTCFVALPLFSEGQTALSETLFLRLHLLKLTVKLNDKNACYRFNSYDGRLDREMEAVVLVMEAFQGHEGRIQYDVVGHSGESHDVTFVDHKNPPTDNKQRLDIIKVGQLCYVWAD